MMPIMSQFTIGIDIGGTNIKLGLVNNSGKVVYRNFSSTKSFVRNKSKLIRMLLDTITLTTYNQRILKSNISGIGIGVPGLVDVSHGIVRTLTNIPGWKNVPLKSIIQNKLGIRTVVDNDVNLITLGEWKYGAGRGYKNIVCLTWGTGVGGGLIIDNRLYRGQGYTAGEIGHISLDARGLKCNCGGRGCLERYVGNKYLLQKARKLFKKADISLEKLTRLAVRGNSRAIRFWQEPAVHFGNALSGVINILNPECIIIGGGIANAHKIVFPTIRKTIKKLAMKIPADMVKITKANLGNDAGIIGAHVLIKHSTTKH